MITTHIDNRDLSSLLACPDCDMLLEKRQFTPTGKISRCPRCGTAVHKNVPDSLQKTIALSLGGLILYIPAVTQPIMTFAVAGMKGSGNVIDAVRVLFEKGYYFVGAMVLLASLVFPLLKLGLLFLCALFVAAGRVPKPVPFMFRIYSHLSEWGMAEVFLLGILVSVIKMHSMADIDFNTGFFCLTAMVLLTVGSSVVVDEDLFWRRIEGKQQARGPGEAAGPERRPLRAANARDNGLVRCADCGKLVFEMAAAEGEVVRCPRCRTVLHGRKPASLSHTWALVLAAAIFYLPANLLPIMRVDFMGAVEDSTIMDGIVHFFQTGDYLIGGIILTASVLVPLFKMVGICLILLSIQFHWHRWLRHKTGMFRFIGFIGRWSFLDIFVIALPAAMVRFGKLSTVEAEPAATFFTAVVVCTMLAALTFDPRLLWDACARNESERG